MKIFAVLAVVVTLVGGGSSAAESAGGTHYSARQVRRAFTDQGVHLRNATKPGWRGIWRLLDGRPAHQIYVYVILYPCKCVFMPPITHARTTHHGDVVVVWRPAERSTVHAALRELR